MSAVAADVTALLGTVSQLCDELAAVRLESANLRAAIHAALNAAAEGESGPLDYLRWELPETRNPSPECGREWCG